MIGGGTISAMESDEERAVRRFNQKERFKLLRDGMPIEAIRMLRQGYVREVLANPEALRQLREGFDLGETTGEVWDKANVEWEALPAVAKNGLRQEDWRQGFIHGWVSGREGFDLGEKPYVTKTGKVLSDAEIESLAEEAERGYDVSHLTTEGNE